MNNIKPLKEHNTLYLDYATVSEIESMDTSKKYSIYISDGADILILKTLNDFLRENKISKINFTFGGSQDYNHSVHNLDCLKYLPEACRILIFPQEKDNTVADLLVVSEYLKDLKDIDLMGMYKKGISLKPLEKFKNSLENIYMEQSLDKNQLKIIDLCDSLKSLGVKEIDMADLNIKNELKTLWIEKDIRSLHLLSDLFPNIDRLVLKKCKSISDLSDIVKIKTLRRITLYFMPQIKTLPSFASISNLESLHLSLSNLVDIENIFLQESLNKLSVMDLKFLTPKDFEKLPQLKKLKNAYVTFKSNKNNVAIKSFIESKGWRYSM